MAAKSVEFNLKNCLSCSICVQACPVSALSLTYEGKSGKYSNLFPELIPGACIGCGTCVKNCPMDCISLVNTEGDNDES